MKRLGILIILLAVMVGWNSFAEEGKTIRSVKEDRLDVIRYGLDSEIIELLSSLRDERDSSLVEEISGLVKNTPNTKIIKEVFEYLRVMKDSRLEAAAYSYIEKQEEVKPEVLIAVLNYLGEAGTGTQVEKVQGLLKNKNQQVVSAVIKNLGKSKSQAAYRSLLALFEEEGTSNQIRSEIVLAFGELKIKEALTPLKKILADEGEDITLRRFACDSIGKLGDPEAVPTLLKALESNDNLLRAYAISAVGSFPGKETEGILLSALRDSFPRVRELAAERIGDQKIQDGIEPLIYRAKKDSEKKVKQASLKALSKLGGEKGLTYLRELFEDEKSPLELRSFTVEQLIDRNLVSSINSIIKVMDQEWKKDNSPLLDTIGKLLSRTESNDLEPFYKKLLEHKNPNIQIYALRGIQKNKMTGLSEQVKELTKEKYPPQVRKQALSLLDGK